MEIYKKTSTFLVDVIVVTEFSTNTKPTCAVCRPVDDPCYSDPLNPSALSVKCLEPCNYLAPSLQWMCGLGFEILIDPSFSNNSCLSSVYNQAGNSPTIDSYLKNFDGTFSVAHLRLAGNSSLSGNPFARTYSPENWVIKIDFNINRLNRPDLDVARTLIHELIHAEMYRKLLMVAEEPNIPWTPSFINNLRDDFPGLYDYYMRWHYNLPNGVPSASPQHQLMAEHYRDVIEQALREFDDSYPDQFYDALSWVGLQGTVRWNNLSQQERNDIGLTVQTFRDTHPPCQN